MAVVVMMMVVVVMMMVVVVMVMVMSVVITMCEWVHSDIGMSAYTHANGEIIEIKHNPHSYPTLNITIAHVLQPVYMGRLNPSRGASCN